MRDMPAVERIFAADVHRDGGSFSFCFYSDDGHWYEFFLETNSWDPEAKESHKPPVLYLESVNGRNVVAALSWSEGKSFVAPLHYANDQFEDLVQVVMREGKPAPVSVAKDAGAGA